MKRSAQEGIRSGVNKLTIPILPTASGEPCALYVRGQVGTLRVVRTSRFPPSATHTKFQLGRFDASSNASDTEQLERGTILYLRHWATNRAGLASSATAQSVMMLDDTRPSTPFMRVCDGVQKQDEMTIFQKSEASLFICWDGPGFVDDESGVWALEWQLARWTGNGWDTLTATQSILGSQLEQSHLLSDMAGQGIFEISMAQLTAAIGTALALHPNRFRVGVRAVNRAGLPSCALAMCSRPPCPCSSVDSAAGGSNTAWAAETGAEVVVDTVGPACVHAKAWLCAPAPADSEDDNALRSTTGAQNQCHDLALDRPMGVGRAEGGFQASTHELHVQWEGFSDADSGISECQVAVEKVAYPGRRKLGERCTCSVAMPGPACDCAPSPETGVSARCEQVSPQLQTIARSRPSEWRSSRWDSRSGGPTEDEEFEWMSLLLDPDAFDLDDSEEVDFAVCVPETPFNLGNAAVSEECFSSIDCAPLSAKMRSYLHPNADQRAICVSTSFVPWWNVEQPARFCCKYTDAKKICLPAAMAAPWQFAKIGLIASPLEMPNAVNMSNASNMSYSPPPLSSPPPSSPPPSSPPPPTCEAVEVDLEVRTGSVELPYEYSHVVWELDGFMGAFPHECDPSLCKGQNTCGCLYRKTALWYTHTLCLTPGTHTLTVYDMMGFGWFGAHVLLRQLGLGQVRLYEMPGAGHITSSPWTGMAATVHTPSACENACTISGQDGSTCLDRLFDELPETCHALKDGFGCSCGGCCLQTEEQVKSWDEALPKTKWRQKQAPWWHYKRCKGVDGAAPALGCGYARRRTFQFDLYAVLLPQHRAPPAPPSYVPVASALVPCNETGLHNHHFTDLTLEHGAAYTVAVLPFDRAGNEAVGCGGPTQVRGRRTDDMSWQRPVIIDATAPALTNTFARPRDVNLRVQQYATPVLPHEGVDSDHLSASPLHVACDWSNLRLSDPESNVAGFWWAISSDGAVSDNVLPWMHVGPATHGAAYMPNITSCELRSVPPIAADEASKASSSTSADPVVQDMALCQRGQRFQCMVRAFNRAGGSAIFASDGFTIDDSAAQAGVVVDGLDMHVDVDFAPYEDQALSASWFGFFDPRSPPEGITYRAGLSKCSAPLESVELHDMGTRATAGVECTAQ